MWTGCNISGERGQEDGKVGRGAQEDEIWEESKLVLVSKELLGTNKIMQPPDTDNTFSWLQKPALGILSLIFFRVGFGTCEADDMGWSNERVDTDDKIEGTQLKEWDWQMFWQETGLRQEDPLTTS